MNSGQLSRWFGNSPSNVSMPSARPRKSDKSKTLAREGYGRNPEPEKESQTTLTSTLPLTSSCASLHSLASAAVSEGASVRGSARVYV